MCSKTGTGDPSQQQPLELTSASRSSTSSSSAIDRSGAPVDAWYRPFKPRSCRREHTRVVNSSHVTSSAIPAGRRVWQGSAQECGDLRTGHCLFKGSRGTSGDALRGSRCLGADA